MYFNVSESGLPACIHVCTSPFSTIISAMIPDRESPPCASCRGEQPRHTHHIILYIANYFQPIGNRIPDRLGIAFPAAGTRIPAAHREHEPAGGVDMKSASAGKSNLSSLFFK